MNIKNYMSSKKPHQHKQDAIRTYQILHENNLLKRLDEEVY